MALKETERRRDAGVSCEHQPWPPRFAVGNELAPRPAERQFGADFDPMHEVRARTFADSPHCNLKLALVVIAGENRIRALGELAAGKLNSCIDDDVLAARETDLALRERKPQQSRLGPEKFRLY